MRASSSVCRTRRPGRCAEGIVGAELLRVVVDDSAARICNRAASSGCASATTGVRRRGGRQRPSARLSPRSSGRARREASRAARPPLAPWPYTTGRLTHRRLCGGSSAVSTGQGAQIILVARCLIPCATRLAAPVLPNNANRVTPTYPQCCQAIRGDHGDCARGLAQITRRTLSAEDLAVVNVALSKAPPASAAPHRPDEAAVAPLDSNQP